MKQVKWKQVSNWRCFSERPIKLSDLELKEEVYNKELLGLLTILLTHFCNIYLISQATD